MDTNETKVYIALLIAAVILGIFLIFFIVTIIRHQQKNQALQKEKINAEIRTLEKERTRIASDLHDDLGPVLSAVKLLINNVDLDSEEDKLSLAKATQYIDSILAQLRTISNNLMPQALIHKGLVVALEEFISELSIEPTEGIHLYRIIQEVIRNAEKHANASEMNISMHANDGKLVLVIKDNGKGFDTKDPETLHRGLGLKNILSRVDTLKGNMYLESGPRKGTEYTIEIPRTQLS